MTLAFGSYASLSGTFAARPAADADQVGRFYFATDTNDLYRDNGTAWQHIGTARTYKVYTALLALSGTNAPAVTVLENTLGGTVLWARSYAGAFTATLTGAFPAGSFSSIPESAVFFDVDGIQVSAICNRASNDVFNLTFYSPDPLSGSPYDPSFDNFSIELYVYP